MPETAPIPVRTGPRFAIVETGAPSDWHSFVALRPEAGFAEGKAFLKEPLAMTGMEVSVNVAPPGFASSYAHAHRENEELFVFLSGVGEMSLDGQVVPVKAGSVVRVDPAGVRAWRNTSSGEPLVCLVIQAKAHSLTQWTLADGIPFPAPSWG